MSTHLSPPLDPLGTGEAPAPAAVAMRSMSTGAHPDVVFHVDLARSLQLHRRLFLAILGFGIVLAAGYFFSAWPVYVAESIVYIQPAPPNLMGNPLARTWPYDENTYESYIQQQISNVTRGDVLRQALHKLPAGSWQRDGEREQAAIERLGKVLYVERMGSGYQISITAKASNAEFAARIANTVAAAFIETAKSDLRAGDPERIRLLGEERARIQKALGQDRAELEQVNRALGVAAVGSASPDPYEMQINQVRSDLEKARVEHDQASARLTSLANPDASSSAALDAEADEIVASDAGLVSMKTWLNQRRAQLISQMANLTPNHPQYKQDTEELAKINASLESMMKDLRARAAAHIEQRLRNDLERTSAFEARLNAQLGQLSGAAGNASSRLQRANDLGLDIQRLQNRFTAVDEQYRNLTLENEAPGAASLSSAAMAPLHPYISHMVRNLAIVLLGALFLGMGAAVAAHHLDPRVYIGADIERVLGFSPMAQLPDFREVSAAAGEEYMLRLAAGIEHAYQQNGLKSCIITGVAPGAGTSTVASRVTTMLEGMGRTTVLVDASGTPPPPAGNEGAVGVADLVPTRADGRPSALLQELAEEMDSDSIVLTDTAPLLVSGETEYLARFVDSAIVVIQSGLTTRAQLREVAQTFARLEVAAVGFVLNRVSIDKANPSFRQSVRAVEQRLAMQNRGRARAARSHASAQRDEAAEEPSPMSRREDVKPPEPAAAQPAAATEAVTDPSLGGQTSEVRRGPEPEAAPSSRVARGRGEPRGSAPRPGRSAAPPPRPAASAPAPIPEPVPRATPPAPKAETGRAPSAAERPAAAPAGPPAHLGASPSPAGDKLLHEDLASERDDAGYVAATRLGGLRNLLVSLGRRSLHTEGDFGGDGHADLEPRFERATVVPAYPDNSVPVADALENGTTTRLSAQPEFLPPKSTAEIEKEKEAVRPAPTAPRRETSDPDEIQTLPSWRGQYRKKRYPPL